VVGLDVLDVRARRQGQQRLTVASDGKSVEDPVGRRLFDLTVRLPRLHLGEDGGLAASGCFLESGNDGLALAELVRLGLRETQVGLVAHVDNIGGCIALLQLFEEQRLDFGEDPAIEL